MSELFTILGLAVAGIDPLGAILLASAISAGIDKSKIIGFTIAVLLSAVVTGTIFSVIGIQFVEQIKRAFPRLNSSIWVYVNIILAVLILVWLYRQTKVNSSKKPKPVKKQRLQGSLFATLTLGIVFGASSVLDPTFAGAIGVAAQTNSIAAIISLHATWIIISQFMLFGLLIAYLLNKHHQLMGWSKRFWQGHKRRFTLIVHGAALVVAIVLVADSIVYIFSGSYLLY